MKLMLPLFLASVALDSATALGEKDNVSTLLMRRIDGINDRPHLIPILLHSFEEDANSRNLMILASLLLSMYNMRIELMISS